MKTLSKAYQDELRVVCRDACNDAKPRQGKDPTLFHLSDFQRALQEDLGVATPPDKRACRDLLGLLPYIEYSGSDWYRFVPWRGK
jgi:hypothetical protein